MNEKELLQFSAQMFDLDGTLTPSINVPKDPRLITNFIRLKTGKLGYKDGAAELLLSIPDKKRALISHMSDKLLKQYITCPPIVDAAPFSRVFDSIKITNRGAKNKTDLMLETLDEWKIWTCDAVYYVDTLKDAVNANDANIRFCLVGEPNAKDLREIKKISPYQIKDFNEIL